MCQPQILLDTETANLFCIQSFTCHASYTVTLPQHWQHWHDQATCTCPHFTEAKKICKHIVAIIQRICERAPLRIHLNTHYYSCEPQEPFFTNEERHCWNTLNASRILFNLTNSDSCKMLLCAPSHDEVVNALLAEHCTFRLRTDSPSSHPARHIAYQLNGACIATDVNPLTFAHHVHILTNAHNHQTFKHVDDLPTVTCFHGMVHTPAYSRVCHRKSLLARWVEFQPA